MDGPQAEELEFAPCGQIPRHEGGEGAKPCPQACVCSAAPSCLTLRDPIDHTFLSKGMRPFQPHVRRKALSNRSDGNLPQASSPMLVCTWADPEIRQIQTRDQSKQDDWPKETQKKCPIYVLQTTMRVYLSLSLPVCLSTPTFFSSQ